jgi:AraC family transcriptional regulator
MVRVQTDPAGVMEVAGKPSAAIVIHIGPSVRISCNRGGKSHHGLSVHGDVDIIPPDVASRWELEERDTALILGIPRKLLTRVAEELGGDPARMEVVNRFQTRDARIEHIGWALKAEMEAGDPNGPLFRDSLGVALAVQLLTRHCSSVRENVAVKGGLSGRRLKQVIAYIEDNLGANLPLEDIAGAAGLSVSHCNAAFRKSIGQPVHQYVVQRRVERAGELLREGQLTIREVALETGFAHQSHLAFHMRRILGVTPRALVALSLDRPSEAARFS